MSRLKSTPAAAAAKTEALQNKIPMAAPDEGIQAAAPTSPLPAATVEAPRSRRRLKHPLWRALESLASLRLTVVLFALSIVLVLCGTVAQMDMGIWSAVHTYFRSFYVFIPFKIFFPRTDFFQSKIIGGLPYPGGLTLGFLLLFNLLAAHFVRFRLTWKRSGILILHFGVVVMMVSELLTYLLAVEGQMQIPTGASSNFLSSTENYELVFINRADPKLDSVTAVPDTKLRKPGHTFTDPALPVDIEVLRYMPNSELLDEKSAEANNPVNAGVGAGPKGVDAVEIPVSKGTDSGGKADFPSAYLRFLGKGDNAQHDLGTYLMSTFLPEQEIKIGDKLYYVGLRHKRTYKPYRIRLDKFTHAYYEGTSVPKDYASDITLYNNEGKEEFRTRIYMNAPLRYNWETFYQQGWLPGFKGTILQVVHNPGWLLPYVSCVLVAGGMLTHFLIVLVGFLSSQGRLTGVRLHGMEWLVPAGCCFLALTYLGGKAIPPREPAGELQMSDLEGLLVQDNGRLKPLSTFARAALMNISGGYQEYKDDEGHYHSAASWLLDALSQKMLLGKLDKDSATVVVDFLTLQIDDPELLDLLGLPAKPDGHYPLRSIQKDVSKERMQEFLQRAFRAGQSETRRTGLDARVSELRHAMLLFAALFDLGANPGVVNHKVIRIENEEVLGMLGLKGRSGLKYALGEFLPMSTNSEQEQRERSERLSQAVSLYVKAKEAGKPELREAKLIEAFDRIAAYAEATRVAMVPPAEGTQWLSIWQAPENDPATRSIETILLGYGLSKTKNEQLQKKAIQAFNDELEKYQGGILLERVPSASRKSGLEVFFNQFAPFWQCAVVYVFVLLLACLSWMVYPGPLNRAAFWLAIMAFAVHTSALLIRMVLMERPGVFVINLYSSAVFIGWVAILLAIVVETIYRNGFGLAAGAIIGIGTTIIAHYLALGNDTLGVLQAVLDTNFWLATHVTTVTIGYSATFFAGVLGWVYIAATVITRGQKREQLKPLYQMIYGIVCFAMLFSFVGTVLGGIWADQSWGRFWGWDSKENGAVIIVIWNALLLHARWGGMARDLGVACLAVFGNVVTSWSWFGTNMLGVGLHSYGFMPAAVAAMLIWIGINLAIIGVGVSVWLIKTKKAPAVAAA